MHRLVGLLLLPPLVAPLLSAQAVQYDANGKQAVLFAFRHARQYNTAAPAIQLKGLDERAVYRLESIDSKLTEGLQQVSGDYLMRRGLNLNLRGDYDSTAVILERVQ